MADFCAIIAVFSRLITMATAAYSDKNFAVLGFPKPPFAPQWDPHTIATCETWQDIWPNENTTRTTCDFVRSDWDISPEQFHEFNPSLSPDEECKGWQVPGTYCVADELRNKEFWQTATHPAWTSARPTTATSAPGAAVTVDGTVVPPPRAWRPAGCYNDTESTSGFNGKILQERVDYGKPGEQVKLTLEVCREACWKKLSGMASFYSGVKNGRECWCGREMLVKEGDPDGGWLFRPFCNIPCEGDADQKCGGEGKMEAFEAVVVYGTGLQWGMRPTSTQDSGEAAPTEGDAEQSLASAWRGSRGMAVGFATSSAALLFCI